jgi:hypothetical protein
MRVLGSWSSLGGLACAADGLACAADGLACAADGLAPDAPGVAPLGDGELLQADKANEVAKRTVAVRRNDIVLSLLP